MANSRTYENKIHNFSAGFPVEFRGDEYPINFFFFQWAEYIMLPLDEPTQVGTVQAEGPDKPRTILVMYENGTVTAENAARFNERRGKVRPRDKKMGKNGHKKR